MILFKRSKREYSSRERKLAREKDRLEKELAKAINDLQCEQRKNRVAEAEIENMAAVIARDRERIEAETSQYARQRAENEGFTNGRAD